jgi:Na+-translocating ferredoxin:NAD+ oxidoreductase RnfG subunit
MIFIMAIGYSFKINPVEHKKINKEILAIWPEKNIQLLPFSINEQERKAAGKIGIEDVFSLVEDQDTLGYYIFLTVPSKLDKFDIGLIYSLNSEILLVKVLTYREDHGGEVGSKRWLKQFIGLGADAPMVLNEDIQGISGATISCESATNGTREATRFLNKLIANP